MSRTRTLFATLALALAVPAGVIGCGGDDGGDEDPEEVLTATFDNETKVSSGVLDISVGFGAGEQGSFDASISGPFQSDPDDPTALPQLDLTASVTGEGQGQEINFEGGLTATEDNGYVTYQDQAYELGTETFEQFKAGFEQAAAEQDAAEDSQAGIAAFTKQCEAAVEQAGGDTAACDIDFASWLTNLTNEGSEDVEGTESVHIHGDADIEAIFSDLTELSEATGESSDVTSDQLSQAEEAISEASIDVYSSTDDNLLTKLDASFSIDPSAIESSTPVPLTEPIDFNFSIAIGDVNSEQTIEAPSGAKPIDDLLGQFGGLGALGALGGAGALGGGSDSSTYEFDTGGGGGGGGAADPNAYFECIEQAGSDAAAITACESKL